MTSSDTASRIARAALGLFARRGYAAVSVDDIAAAAGMTKGAVYYQFRDKKDVFRAVCAAIIADIITATTQETMGHVAHAIDEIVTGGDKLFDAYESGAARQCLLIDAPSVLGPAEWSDLQEPLRVELGEHALNHLVEAGLLPKSLVPMMAHLLFGAFTQGVLQISAAEDKPLASRRARAAFKRLARGLLAGDEGRPSRI